MLDHGDSTRVYGVASALTKVAGPEELPYREAALARANEEGWQDRYKDQLNELILRFAEK